MFWFGVVVLSVLSHSCGTTDLKFPSTFKFGAGTSAYQIEGGWNADGKGESVWDRLTHTTKNVIYNNATGDIASDSYNKWREDIKAASEIGLHFYKFSISWTRILPNGFSKDINQAGVAYYNNLIDGLLAAGIEPVVTLYHFDLPQIIQDLGGWTNPLIAKWFGDYARIVFSLYSDRVKTWLTINEPVSFCDHGYNYGNFGTSAKETEFAPFLCNKHVLLAHAKAYRIYDKEFRPKYHGRVSLANDLYWVEPASDKFKDVAEIARQYTTGRYAHPIYSKTGGWPSAVEELMSQYSQRQGYHKSRLPAFTQEEKEFIRGTADFFAMNHYSTKVIGPATDDDDELFFFNVRDLLNASLTTPPGAYNTASKMIPAYPVGIRHQLKWLKQQYGDVEVFITENGYSSTGGLRDDDRWNYIKQYLEQILLSMTEDGVNVTGYTYWSLIDHFEWWDGFSAKFGLYEVDFSDPERPRAARASARHYSCVIQTRSLNIDSCMNST